MSGPKNALAAWGQSALRPVQLPTGMKALVRLPEVAKLLQTDHFPEDLRALAHRYASGGINVAELQPDELVKFIQFTYEITAPMVRYLAPADSPAWDDFRSSGASPTVEGWQPVSLTGGELRELEVDQSDLDALAKIAARQATPNEITAMSRFDAGLATLADVKGEIASDPDGRVSDFAPFHRGPGRADSGADGEDVLDEAVGASVDPGSSDRVRGRRSGRS
jgi:hypothetical protein